MSRNDLHDFLVRNVEGLTPERETLITAVMARAIGGHPLRAVPHGDRRSPGLNPSDHKCADLISNETEPVTAGRLAEITGLTTGAITGVVDRLERAGLVAREPDAEDRRRVLIKRTDRTPIMRDLFMPMMEGLASLCATYSNEELALIAGFHAAQHAALRVAHATPATAGAAARTERIGARGSSGKYPRKASKSGHGTRKR